MGTMAMSTAERAKLVDRYVALSAIETFFERILDPRGELLVCDLLASALNVTDAEWPETLVDLEDEITGLYGRLWPDDPVSEQASYRAAEARARLGAARMFVNAAGRPDLLAAEADVLIAKAPNGSADAR